MKDGTFITLQSWMIKKLKLKGNELIIYGLIHGFCQDGESYFYGGIDWIMEQTNTGKDCVINTLKSLVNKKLVTKITKTIRGSQISCLYYTNESRKNRPELWEGQYANNAETNSTSRENRPVNTGNSPTSRENRPVNTGNSPTSRENRPVNSTETNSTSRENRPVNSTEASSTGRENRPVNSTEASSTGRENRPVNTGNSPASRENRPVNSTEASSTGRENRPVNSTEASSTGRENRPVNSTEASPTGRENRPVRLGKTDPLISSKLNSEIYTTTTEKEKVVVINKLQEMFSGSYIFDNELPGKIVSILKRFDINSKFIDEYLDYVYQRVEKNKPSSFSGLFYTLAVSPSICQDFIINKKINNKKKTCPICETIYNGTICPQCNFDSQNQNFEDIKIQRKIYNLPSKLKEEMNMEIEKVIKANGFTPQITILIDKIYKKYGVTI